MTAAGWPLRWQPLAGGKVAAREMGLQPTPGSRPTAAAGTQIDAGARRSLDPLSAFHSLSRRLGRHSAMATSACAPAAPDHGLLRLQHQANSAEVAGDDDAPMGQNWVGDLMLEATLDARSPQGRVAARSGPGGPAFPLRHRVGRRARRSSTIDGAPDFSPGPKRPSAARAVTASFLPTSIGNCCCGSTAAWCSSTPRPPTRPGQRRSQPATIWPRPASARAGRRVKVEHLLLERDVYYIAAERSSRSAISDYEPGERSAGQRDRILRRARPLDAATACSLAAEVEFPLEADQFFVLGDNSPASKDSRLVVGRGEQSRVLRVARIADRQGAVHLLAALAPSIAVS